MRWDRRKKISLAQCLCVGRRWELILNHISNMDEKYNSCIKGLTLLITNISVFLFSGNIPFIFWSNFFTRPNHTNCPLLSRVAFASKMHSHCNLLGKLILEKLSCSKFVFAQSIAERILFTMFHICFNLT